MVQVIVSKVVGFCGGVKQAINLANSAAGRCRGRTYVDGVLVHNGQVMEDLKNAGVELLNGDDWGRIAPSDCIVIRAHGVPKARRAQLESHFGNVVDGTCLHVRRVSRMVERAAEGGRPVIIVGNRNHPEVLALASVAAVDKCFVVNSKEEVLSLPPTLDDVLVVAQSTIGEEFFNDLAGEIAKICPNGEIQNTICRSSRERQRAIATLKKSGAQAIVVIGGRHSNNAATLVEVAKGTALPVFFIETVADLYPLPLEKFSTVGVASGASTGEENVREVVDYLGKL